MLKQVLVQQLLGLGLVPCLSCFVELVKDLTILAQSRLNLLLHLNTQLGLLLFVQLHQQRYLVAPVSLLLVQVVICFQQLVVKNLADCLFLAKLLQLPF